MNWKILEKKNYGFLAAMVCLAFVLSAIRPIMANAQAPPPEKRTVFVIGHINAIFNFPLMAWVIVDDDIFLAETWNSINRDGGPVGLAVDENNENLFVSYEFGDTIEVFDARDATPLGSITLWGTSDLAGMVVHQDRGHLYVVDRATPNVFVFDTTTFAPVDQWILPTGNGAWGIDLLGDQLFVADGSFVVRYYDIDTHLEAGSMNQTLPAVSIAVTDYPENLVYTAAINAASSPFLNKYYMTSGVEERVTVGNKVKGVTINPALELAYVVADNKIHVVDSDAMAVLYTKNLNFTWSPTDTLATFIPFGGTVQKTCTSHPNGKFRKDETAVFEVAIQNRHPLPIHEMKVQDVYDNTQLHFVSSNPPADDSNDDGQIDWADIISQVGADLDTGEWLTIEVTFDVIEECVDILEGVNTATMYDVKDTEGTALPDATGQFEYQIDCNCKTNLDCDDSVFCNGSEICLADGTCESPGNPCPLDDGLYCNGTETADCDEALDECGHENVPCEDDNLWCNGTEVCNEDTDSCTDSGPPCSDDGQFCNGEESCDENSDACVSSGDPCNPGQECNESTDSCDATDVTDDDDDDGGEPTPLWPEGKVTGGCCGCDE